MARGVLSTQRLSVRRRGPCPVHVVRTVRTPIRQQRKRRCMPCRCMPNPPLATGNRTRHVCAADNLQTRCKQQAPESPPQTIPGNRAEVGKMPAPKGSRRCDPTHRKRPLSSYADGFDGLGGGLEGKIGERSIRRNLRRYSEHARIGAEELIVIRRFSSSTVKKRSVQARLLIFPAIRRTGRCEPRIAKSGSFL